MITPDKKQISLDESQWKDNAYYQSNPKMFIELALYVKKYPISCCKVISRKYRLQHLPQNADIIELMSWIIQMTSQFKFDIELQTRVYCIMQNITSIEQFPICRTCGKPIIQNVYSFSKGFVQLKYCNAKCRANNEDFKQMILDDRMKKYGNIFGDLNKIAETRILHYGHKNPKLSESLKRTYQQRKDEIENKKKQTLFKNYGVTNPMHSSKLRAKQNIRIWYDNTKFDSMVELAFYIWLIDHNIEFEFQPSTTFEYTFNGKTYKYCPDFYINGQFIEIKGDHFFKEDGTMQNPFNHAQDALYEAKHQCMLKNNVKILRQQQYIKYVNYVEAKYGSSYLQQFKYANKVNKT